MVDSFTDDDAADSPLALRRVLAAREEYFDAFYRDSSGKTCEPVEEDWDDETRKAFYKILNGEYR